MNLTDWIVVAAAILGGFVIGIIASRLIARVLGNESRPKPIQDAATPLGSLGFWSFVIIGLMIALGRIQPSALEQMPRDLIAFLPKIISAAILVIGANILSSFALAAVAPAMGRASAAVQRQVALLIKSLIMGLATVVAVSQIGINTTVVNIAVAAIFFGVAASLTLLVGLGGRQVAGEVASTRAARRLVKEGDLISLGEVRGRVVGVKPTAVEVELPDGDTMYVPSSRFINSDLTIRRGM